MEGVMTQAIGTSPVWRSAVAAALGVAATEATVLLQGESGTGKEFVAEYGLEKPAHIGLA
jgi:transcriptional regulator with GAF, ATPase, and Fis domain